MKKKCIKNTVLLLICGLFLTSINTIPASAWSGDSHWDCITESDQFDNLDDDEKAVLNYACRFNDNESFYMGVGPKGQFHGGLWNNWATGDGTNSDDCNYLACYIYLTKVANAFGGSGTLLAAHQYLTNIDTNSATIMDGTASSTPTNYVINSSGILDSTGTSRTSWSTIQTKMNTWLANNSDDGTYNYTGTITLTSNLKRTFVYGMALHAATDTFAHSAWSCNDGTNWYRLGSSNNSGADDTDVRSSRYSAAQEVASNVIDNYIAGNCGDIYDFALATTTYYNFNTSYVTTNNNAFRLGNFLKYATAIDSSASSNTQFKVPDAARTCALYGWTLQFENHKIEY